MAGPDPYKRIFLRNNMAPWPCHFCEMEITLEQMLDWPPSGPGNFEVRDRAVVHHVDHNRHNDHPDNLVPTHDGCHRAYHASAAKGVLRSPGGVNALSPLKGL